MVSVTRHVRQLLNASVSSLASFLLISKSALGHYESEKRKLNKDTKIRLQSLSRNLSDALKKIESGEKKQYETYPVARQWAIKKFDQKEEQLKKHESEHDKLTREFELVMQADQLLEFIVPTDIGKAQKIQQNIIELWENDIKISSLKYRRGDIEKLQVKIAGLRAELEALSKIIA